MEYFFSFITELVKLAPISLALIALIITLVILGFLLAFTLVAVAPKRTMKWLSERRQNPGKSD